MGRHRDVTTSWIGWKAHDRRGNRIICLVDLDKVAILDFRAIKQASHPSPVRLPFSIQAFYHPNTTLRLFPRFLVCQIYSSCLPATATAAPATASPALAPPALTKPANEPLAPPSSSNATPCQTRAPTAIELARVRISSLSRL